jgi:hypothetical protein
MSMLAQLPDIDEVAPFGGKEGDEECFAELRAVLAKYGALQRFGVTLLHQHFDISEDEVLVETVDVENRILTSTPGATNQINTQQRVIETSWRLDDPRGARRCETKCVSDVNRAGDRFHNRKHYTTG